MAHLVFASNNFQCHLFCAQCDFILSNGDRCKRRVCLGSPTCWQHNIKRYGVKTKQSTIVNAGKGLFATEMIRKGDWICPYKGEIISDDCLISRYDSLDLDGERTAPYTVADGDRLIVDAACKRGIGAFANTNVNRSGKSKSVNQHNARLDFNEEEGEIWLYAIKTIKRNDEIFLFYGDDYIIEEDAYTTGRNNQPDTRPC